MRKASPETNDTIGAIIAGKFTGHTGRILSRSEVIATLHRYWDDYVIDWATVERVALEKCGGGWQRFQEVDGIVTHSPETARASVKYVIAQMTH